MLARTKILCLRKNCSILYRFLQRPLKMGSDREIGSDVEDSIKSQLFTLKANPTTGKSEWVVENEQEHDYYTDIARSSYADMLHDHERNLLYYKAINLAIATIQDRGETPKVLDIGTGSGLLSMMAAKCGAETINAIEVFTPMAEVAKRVTKQNGFPNINVINKHSTEVTIGPDGDIKEKANILITELFDTELIGEGALRAYQHAHQFLMEENCIAVPHRAMMYASIVASSTMQAWYEMCPINVSRLGKDSVTINPNPEMIEGAGAPAVHDIQLSQFPQHQLKILTNPTEVFDFKWNDKNLSPKPRSNVVKVKSIASGTAQIVLCWWDLEMDENGKIILSTAPRWHHPTPNCMQWRDHWMQSVYFLPQNFKCQIDDLVTIQAFHDEYSLWFNSCVGENLTPASIKRPSCDYPPRMLWSRSRLGMVNDSNRNKIFVEALDEISAQIPADGMALCISDFSLLSMLITQTCFKDREVVALEKNKIGQRGLINLIRHNNLDIEVTCSNAVDVASDLEGQKISLLAGEPFFTNSYLPWHNLHFWYARTELDSYLHRSFKVMPYRAHLTIAAVEFADLWKIRAPIGSVEGFDISPMDEMIEHALEMKEYHEPEPQPLWEYPSTLLTLPERIMTFDFRQLIPDHPIYSTGKQPIDLEINQGSNLQRTCHGVVLWMEYDLSETRTISTGLQPDGSWSMHHKQAVFLLKKPVNLRELIKTPSKELSLWYDVTFFLNSKEGHTAGDMEMTFNIVDS